MGESAAVDVVSEVEFEAIAQVVRGILPKRTMLVDGDGLTINIEESGMVDCGVRQQAEQLNRLNGKQDDDAPDGTGRKIADWDEHQAVGGKTPFWPLFTPPYSMGLILDSIQAISCDVKSYF